MASIQSGVIRAPGNHPDKQFYFYDMSTFADEEVHKIDRKYFNKQLEQIVPDRSNMYTLICGNIVNLTDLIYTTKSMCPSNKSLGCIIWGHIYYDKYNWKKQYISVNEIKTVIESCISHNINTLIFYGCEFDEDDGSIPMITIENKVIINVCFRNSLNLETPLSMLLHIDVHNLYCNNCEFNVNSLYALNTLVKNNHLEMMVFNSRCYTNLSKQQYYIEDECIEIFGELLKANTSLSSLDLSGFYHSDDKQLEYICNALKTNSTITSVSLPDTVFVFGENKNIFSDIELTLTELKKIESFLGKMDTTMNNSNKSCVVCEDIATLDYLVNKAEKKQLPLSYDSFISCIVLWGNNDIEYSVEDIRDLIEICNEHYIFTLYVNCCKFRWSCPYDDFPEITVNNEFFMENVYIKSSINVNSLFLMLLSINVRHLYYKQCNFNYDELYALNEMLKEMMEHSSLEKLAFRKCKTFNVDDIVEYEFIKEFSDLLKTNSSLTSLDLRGFYHTYNGLLSNVCKSLETNSELTSLAIPSDGCIGDFDFLLKNKTLTDLNIDFYGDQSETYGLIDMTKCLRKNTTLTTLSINTDSARIVDNVIQSMKHNSSIYRLNIIIIMNDFMSDTLNWYIRHYLHRDRSFEIKNRSEKYKLFKLLLKRKVLEMLETNRSLIEFNVEYVDLEENSYYDDFSDEEDSDGYYDDSKYTLDDFRIREAYNMFERLYKQ